MLAIAAAKLFRVPVLATDIDPRAVAAARANARHNGVGTLVTAIHAAGLCAPQIAARAPFDLVLANILLAPLQRLAAPMARQLMPNARVVLSGLLPAQASAALAAYRSQGLVLERSFTLDGWATLVLVALQPLIAADHADRVPHLPLGQRIEHAQEHAARGVLRSTCASVSQPCGHDSYARLAQDTPAILILHSSIRQSTCPISIDCAHGSSDAAAYCRTFAVSH